MKELINFLIGDYSADGHGQTDTFTLEIEHNCSDIEKRLEENEQKLLNEYDIDLSLWFKEYEDNIISNEDVQKLNNLKINYDNTWLNENNELSVWDGEQYLDIWIQLMHFIDKDIKINKANVKTYFGSCTGYGLYE